MTQSFDPAQEAAVREEMKEGGRPTCPACGVRLRFTPVPPRADVSYVRRRLVVECDSCGRRAVLDLKP